MLYFRSFAVIAVSTLLLTACGGSTSNNLGVLQSSIISGTAATTNFPIANAIVTLKDSSSPSRTATTTTDSQGHYAFALGQIQGYAAPFMLQTSYTVGGAPFYLHTIVIGSDYVSGSTIANITPLTDAVVANVLGTAPQVEYTSAAYTATTSATLVNGEQALDALLQPLFSQAGISSTTPDLMHQQFTANTTGMGSLINMVHVDIDPITKSEILTNTLTGATISGTLNSPATTPLSGTVGASLTTQQAIATLFKNLSTQFASSPTATTPALLAYFDQTNFLNNGQALPAFLQTTISNTQVTGGSFALTDVVLSAVPSYVTLPSGVSAATAYNATFTAVQNNKPIGRFTTVVYQNASGNWVILGNQQKAQLSFATFAGDNNNTTCTGLQIGITDVNGFTNGSATVPVSYAFVTGPGLPFTLKPGQTTSTQGLLFFQNGSSSTLTLAASGATYSGTTTTAATGNCYSNIFGMTDSQIGQIDVTQLPAAYAVELHNVTGGVDTTLATYPAQVLVPPLTSTQIQTSIFPTGITATPALLTAAASATPITVAWSAPTINTETDTTSTTAASEGSYNLLPYALYLSVAGTSGGGSTVTNIPLQAIPVPLTDQITVTPPATTAPVSGSDLVTVSYIDSIYMTIWASPAP